MNDITVGLATDQDARACLALLPEVKGAPVELLIARRGRSLAGAAAISWRNWSRPPGFPTTVGVVPDARGQGVGRRLLAAAIDLACEETDGLWCFEAVPEDGPAAAFMRACGFAPRLKQHYYLASIDALLANITPLLTKLRRRAQAWAGTGGVAAARIVTLAEAPVDEVGWLVTSQLGGGTLRAVQRLRREVALGAASLDRSQVALVDGELAGMILWRLDKGIAVVEARVVAERWRGGPINLILLEAGLWRCKAEGLTEARFHCDDTVRDTISLARRASAVETATHVLFHYPIAPD